MRYYVLGAVFVAFMSMVAAAALGLAFAWLWRRARGG
jgi:hypothetical protein